MGKKRKPKGLMERLLAPLQRITLTEPGKKQAPMRKGQPVKKTAAKPAPPVKLPVVLTARTRQARELKTMYDIGKKDPERLARIISRMLHDASLKNEAAQLKYERLIWEKADKHGRKKETE